MMKNKKASALIFSLIVLAIFSVIMVNTIYISRLDKKKDYQRIIDINLSNAKIQVNALIDDLKEKEFKDTNEKITEYYDKKLNSINGKYVIRHKLKIYYKVVSDIFIVKNEKDKLYVTISIKVILVKDTAKITEKIVKNQVKSLTLNIN